METEATEHTELTPPVPADAPDGTAAEEQTALPSQFGAPIDEFAPRFTGVPVELVLDSFRVIGELFAPGVPRRLVDILNSNDLSYFVMHSGHSRRSLQPLRGHQELRRHPARPRRHPSRDTARRGAEAGPLRSRSQEEGTLHSRSSRVQGHRQPAPDAGCRSSPRPDRRRSPLRAFHRRDSSHRQGTSPDLARAARNREHDPRPLLRNAQRRIPGRDRTVFARRDHPTDGLVFRTLRRRSFRSS